MKINFCSIIALLTIMLASVFPSWASETKIVRFVGQWPFHPTKAVAVDTTRGFVFLGDGDRFCVLDDQLQLQSNIQISPNADIAGISYADGTDYVYVASRSDGLWIVDISDAMDPRVVNEQFQPVINYNDGSEIKSEVTGVYARDGIAYIAGGLSGVQVVDVAQPEHPTLNASIPLSGAFSGLKYAIDTYVSGDYLYIGDLINGIHIYEISDLTQPKKIIALPGTRDISVSGDYLYAAREGNGLEIIDITNPDAPEQAGFYYVEGRERSIATNGDTVYVGYNAKGVHVLDVSSLSEDMEPSHDPAWEYTSTGAKSLKLDASSNSLYVTDDVVGLQKIDATDPAAMTRLQTFDTPADAIAIAVKDGYAFILDDKVGGNPGDEGLRILEMTSLHETLQFQLSGFAATPGNAQDIFIDGNFAYIADGTKGLSIIDIEDKANPVIAGSADISGEAVSVYVNDNHAYVSAGENGIFIFNVENPQSPVFANQLTPGGRAKDLFVSDTYLYAVLGETGIVIYDLSAPDSPQAVSSVDTSGDTQGITVDGNHAYVSLGSQGFSIFDVTDNASPEKVTTYDTAGFARRISISGNYAYVADGENGVTVVNISDPSEPSEVVEWSFDTTGNTTDIVSGISAGDDLFVIAADGPAGVIALNPTYEEDFNEEQNGGGSSGGCFIGVLR